MIICKAKIDSKGRMQFPKSFLSSNKIKTNSEVKILPINGQKTAVRLVFELEK